MSIEPRPQMRSRVVKLTRMPATLRSGQSNNARRENPAQLYNIRISVSTYSRPIHCSTANITHPAIDEDARLHR